MGPIAGHSVHTWRGSCRFGKRPPPSRPAQHARSSARHHLCKCGVCKASASAFTAACQRNPSNASAHHAVEDKKKSGPLRRSALLMGRWRAIEWRANLYRPRLTSPTHVSEARSSKRKLKSTSWRDCSRALIPPRRYPSQIRCSKDTLRLRSTTTLKMSKLRIRMYRRMGHIKVSTPG